jgi:hypothetical protein
MAAIRTTDELHGLLGAEVHGQAANRDGLAEEACLRTHEAVEEPERYLTVESPA